MHTLWIHYYEHKTSGAFFEKKNYYLQLESKISVKIIRDYLEIF